MREEDIKQIDIEDLMIRVEEMQYEAQTLKERLVNLGHFGYLKNIKYDDEFDLRKASHELELACDEVYSILEQTDIEKLEKIINDETICV